jgi:hypothetical protein
VTASTGNPGGNRLTIVIALLLTTLVTPGRMNAQNPQLDSATKVSFGGYLDTYYAFDFNRPREHDRAFTTQAARHNEFNVNLAFLEATLSGNRLRGRVAAQFGTSVQANYASEPRIGTLSGPDVSRFLQEAVVGYELTPHTWIDAGIFLSSFGSENWASRDNWTYTRSMVAENSPYYESGLKVTWRASRSLIAQVHLINGWQNVSENNSGKAVGARLDYSPISAVSLGYDAFLGNEAPDSAVAGRRVWNEGIFTIAPSRRFQLRGTVDYGVQRGETSRRDSWWGYSLIGRYAVTSKLAAAIRSERFEDPAKIIVATGLPYGLRASGYSFSVDFRPAPGLLWRMEYRELASNGALFPSRTNELVRGDKVMVSSAALTF